MKPRMRLYSGMMMLTVLMTAGPGCAHPYPPPRYFDAISTPPYPPQRIDTYRAPSSRYQVTDSPAVWQTRAGEARAAEFSRRANRRIAEIEARAKRRTGEIEARVKRQMEEIQRHVARPTEAASRQAARSAWNPSPPPTWETFSCPDEEISVVVEDAWTIRLGPDVNVFSDIQTDSGFVPHVFATDTRALFVWPLASGDDANNAAMNLVGVKNELLRSEPDAIVEMVLLSDNGQALGMAQWQSQGVRCLDVSQFSVFADRFFSAPNEQNHSWDGTSPSVGAEETGGEFSWEAMFAKARDGTMSVTKYFKTAPWWVWVLGAFLLFVAVFSACVRDANAHPFQSQDGDPWVRDPSGH